MEFSPQISEVGQVDAAQLRVPVYELNTTFLLTLGWNWDRAMLTLDVGIDLPGPIEEGTIAGILKEEGIKGLLELDETMNMAAAPRALVGALIPALNNRLTASGTTVGDPTIIAGIVIRVEGVGEQFGGLYRVTRATHTIDSGGFQTSFEARKEIWFGSIPAADQGAIPVGLDIGFAGELSV